MAVLVRYAALALAGLVVLSAGPVVPKPKELPLTPVPIEVRAAPIMAFERGTSERLRFGALEFRGGLVLSSDYPGFGGISGMSLDATGTHLLAVTDAGLWLRARIMTDGDRPVALADATMSAILGPNGRPLAASGRGDVEGLTFDGGTAYISIERIHSIYRFDIGKDGLTARGQEKVLPHEVQKLRSNRGLEAIVAVPTGNPLAGALIAIAESGETDADHMPGFLIGGPSPGIFRLKQSDNFSVTDAALLPGGMLLVLERRFSPLRGPAMRIRRVPLATIKPGLLVDGEVLVEANFAYEIDNMEAIAVHRNAAGETLITLISDDNFNPLQRTILLRFALVER